jgi:hypothetical protein
MIRLTTSALRKNTGGALNTVAAGMNRTAIQQQGKDVAFFVPVVDYACT